MILSWYTILSCKKVRSSVKFCRGFYTVIPNLINQLFPILQVCVQFIFQFSVNHYLVSIATARYLVHELFDWNLNNFLDDFFDGNFLYKNLHGRFSSVLGAWSFTAQKSW